MEAKQTPAHADFETTEYFFYLRLYRRVLALLWCPPSFLQKVHDLTHIIMLKPIFGVVEWIISQI